MILKVEKNCLISNYNLKTMNLTKHKAYSKKIALITLSNGENFN